MAKHGEEAEKNFDLSAFKKDFKERFGEDYGDVKAAAEAAGVTANTVSRWGAPYYDGLPTIWHMVQIAAQLDVSPSWLAFGLGPRDPALAKQAFHVGELFEKDPRIAKALAAFEAANEDGRQALELLARQFVALPMGTQISAGASDTPAKKVYDSPAAKVGEEPAAYPAPLQTGEAVSKKVLPQQADTTKEAWQIMRDMKLHSKEFTPRSIGAPAPTHQITQADIRAAADAAGIGSGIPLIAETEPVEIKYDKKNHYTLKFVGRSMYPKMQEGDTLIVQHVNYFMPIYDEDRGGCDPKAWSNLDGKVVVALVDDDPLQAVIKRIEVMKNKKMVFKILLRSDNGAVKSIEIREDNSLRIIGIVREIMRKPDLIE